MEKIENRLNRVEGQIRGIQRMYKDGRECMEVAQQIAAVRSALASVGREILSGEAVRCSVSLKDRAKFEKVIRQLFEFS
jgi:DNA-binding FrmR family transcriptional regulator